MEWWMDLKEGHLHTKDVYSNPCLSLYMATSQTNLRVQLCSKKSYIHLQKVLQKLLGPFDPSY